MSTPHKFVICTKDYSGLGWAIRLKDEGNKVLIGYKPDEETVKDFAKKPEDKKAFDLVGNGLVQKFPLDELIKRRAQMRDWYWLWDYNHNPKDAELLKKEGFKVFEGGEFNDKMEHDRTFALKFAEKYGLQSPPSFPFTDTATAIKFVEQNEETAYVFKPDEGENYETWVPESETAEKANEELQVHLQSLQGTKGFILQERKEGVETNVEVHFVKGEPKFAFMCIECKKKINKDLGEMAGCAFDFAFQIPLDSRAVKESVGKMFGAYKSNNFTGYVDANFIAAKDGIYFFESCNRFGYNSHPNLMFNLNLDPFGDTVASMVDGNWKPNFAKGFGASVTLYTDHPKSGKAVQFPPEIEKSLYWFDVYKQGDIMLTAGFSDLVLIVTAFGYTIPTAWENVVASAEKIKFPGRAYRSDGDKTDYFSSPIRRYEALETMGYL